MSDRLKAWCHWKRKENHVSEDDMLKVRDIEALLEENAKLRAVVEIVKEINKHEEVPCFTWDGWQELNEALKKLETTNG